MVALVGLSGEPAPGTALGDLPLVLAHLGHWYEAVLYALPMIVIGAVLWYTARRERADGGQGADEHWDGEDDPRWDDDPRLRDD